MLHIMLLFLVFQNFQFFFFFENLKIFQNFVIFSDFTIKIFIYLYFSNIHWLVKAEF